MRISFLPDVVLPHLTDVTPALLRELSVTALLLDFDNTIVPYTTDRPTPEMDAWLRGIRESGIFLCVVSNTHKPRAGLFCEKYGIPCVTGSRKPFQKGIREALARFSLARASTALIGDQIFTDVLGANRGGLTSVLITPIRLHNVWLRLRRALEEPFIFAARKRRRG